MVAKKLYRSKKDKRIAGVCGGIGEYFDVDPTLIRLLWIIFLLIGGSGLLAYIIAWIIIPENPKQ
ncbi:MAG: PspC domain-containing protein [Nanoarchaeota archaeon]|nr:PspC domain-containing protein [Nanoarchaeota archaeon]MBU1030116.1 PspC domain-containing protein [Nanoarchaeota archaeon]MBU1849999.1 PspC domain-containing protein [Nanoarchaeota archaeon]